MNLYNPDQAAMLVGVSPTTIRNYCKTYAEFLSEGANPPSGSERRLLQQDVATLQQIKVWRDNRLTADEIANLLQAAAKRNEPLPITIDVAPQKAQEGDSEAKLLSVTLSSMRGEIEALQRDFQAMQHDQKRLIDNALWKGQFQGAMAGMVMLATFFVVAWLLVNGWPW